LIDLYFIVLATFGYNGVFLTLKHFNILGLGGVCFVGVIRTLTYVCYILNIIFAKLNFNAIKSAINSKRMDHLIRRLIP
jgi:hypothetical protein